MFYTFCVKLPVTQVKPVKKQINKIGLDKLGPIESHSLFACIVYCLLCSCEYISLQ